MNKRVENLRENSLNTEVTLSHERAALITEFYKFGICMEESVPVSRALCLKHILENKKISILKNELIVGERGPTPKAVPTYPEICLHTVNDLESLDAREKIPYKVSSKTKEIYKKDIIPFWQNKSIREKIFASIDKEWINAFEAGIFTEFQEQRSPGHTACGSMIYKKGFKNLKDEIKDSMDLASFISPQKSVVKICIS